MKNLIIVDDHKMLRKGIHSYFTENSDWNVIAEAESLDEVSAILKKNQAATEENCTVAIVDIQIKGKNEGLSNGFEAVSLLRKSGIPSVVFSSHDTGSCIERAMSFEVGARGFVSKLSDEKMLLDAVNTVSQGKTFIQPDLITSFLNTQNLFSILTRRETQIVKLIQDGLSNIQIAEELEIKISTLENYLSIIYDKVGCKNRKNLLEKLS